MSLSPSSLYLRGNLGFLTALLTRPMKTTGLRDARRYFLYLPCTCWHLFRGCSAAASFIPGNKVLRATRGCHQLCTEVLKTLSKRRLCSACWYQTGQAEVCVCVWVIGKERGKMQTTRMLYSVIPNQKIFQMAMCSCPF